MDINVLDKDLNVVCVIDSFRSLIWNDKYDEPGDFELCVPAGIPGAEYLLPDYYIEIPDSPKTMIIEKQQPSTDVDDGDTIIFSGRSLESLLDRRIVWQQTTVSGNLQNAIKTLINENAISPTISDRTMTNLIFTDSTDTNVASITIDSTQFTGDNLLEVVETLTQNNNLGFKILLNSNNKFEFQLYSGTDRSFNQTTYPQVEFSLRNDNLFSSKRTLDKTNYKNVTLIAGEGEGLDRTTATYGSASDLERREYFTDARDISSNEGSEDEIAPAEYQNLLVERGKSKLDELQIEREVEAEVDTSEYAMFQYQEDYFIGDVVNVVDRFGVTFTARVTEMTVSINSSGYSSYPIFEYEYSGEE